MAYPAQVTELIHSFSKQASPSEACVVQPQLPQSFLFLLQLIFNRLQLLQQTSVCAVHPRVHHIDRHGQTEPA